MKYTLGADHRKGSHLTDLIVDGPMFCKVLRIVFTLFFFLFLLGTQYPVSLGPMIWLLNHVFACVQGLGRLKPFLHTIQGGWGSGVGVGGNN